MNSEAKMFHTHVDLPQATREQMIALLNAHLADALDLYSQTKQAHWNLKGIHFQELHELFDELAGSVLVYVDDIAERATALGGTALGTARMSAASSRLPEMPFLVDGRDFVGALVDRYGQFANSTRAAIDTAANAGDQNTADLFTTISREMDKHLWFLEAHCQG